MIGEFFIDMARFAHFVGLALGIGAGSFADWSILRKKNNQITSVDLHMLQTLHRHVWAGLILLWISGLVLLYARTGFVSSQFSPKLLTKLAVVVVLTANALLIGLFAMPVLKRNLNRPFMAFPLLDKVSLSIIGGLSVCSWLSALILGIFKTLKFAGFERIFPIFSTLYLGAMVAAVTVALGLHLVWKRRELDRECDAMEARASRLSATTEIVGATGVTAIRAAQDTRLTIQKI